MISFFAFNKHFNLKYPTESLGHITDQCRALLATILK
jgi:hypothetical protein